MFDIQFDMSMKELPRMEGKPVPIRFQFEKNIFQCDEK